MSDRPRTKARSAITASAGWRGLAFSALLLAASTLDPAAPRAEEAAAPAAAEAGTTIVTSHGISAFGDLKYPADFKNFDYVNPDAPKGGTMSFRGTGASQTFDSLNNFILKGEPAQGLGLIYDTLLAGSDDEPDSSYGLVAGSIEYPEDRAWVIFNLRPEAKFSDGVPITAEDVVFTYQTLLEKGAPVYQIILKDIASVEALDPQRVKFTFRPEAPKRDLPQLAGSLPVLPKHYYETVDFAASTLTPPIGSGPYVIDAVQAGKSIRYCRNPDYWARDLPVNVGANNFDCILYQYFADNNAAFEALKVGDYFFHEEFSSAIWATSYNFPALEKGWVKKAEVPDGRPAGTQGFWMNLRREKLQDQRVRAAIGLMFNFEWTNKAIFHGLNQRTTSFWMNSPMAASGLPEGEELAVLEPFRDRLPPEIFTEPAWTPPVQKPDRLDRASIRQASKLLDDAGWKVGPDGMRRNDKGETLSLAFVDDNASFEPIINTFVTNLRQIGIDASYRQIDAAQMQERQKNFDYDIIPARFVMPLSPSLELRQFFSSESANAAGTVNLTGLADPVVDALIEKIIAATTRDEMEARVRALDRVLRQKQIWVSNWYRPYYWLAYWDVFGMPPAPPKYGRGDAYWWFDQAKFDRLKAEGALR